MATAHVQERETESFHTTSWTIVLASVQTRAPEAPEALAALCESYWRPLFAYLRRRGHSEPEAQDLVQAFFLHLIEHGTLSRADRERGRFRTFLLSCLQNFVADERLRESRQKRGGDIKFISLDAFESLDFPIFASAHEQSPEEAFDVDWALALIELVFHRLRAEAQARGREQTFEELKSLVVTEATEETGAIYRNICAKLGLSLVALKTAVHRLRARFRVLIREEVARTLAAPDELENELHYLRTILTRAQRPLVYGDGRV